MSEVKCVCIELDDKGKYTVGLEPPDDTNEAPEKKGKPDAEDVAESDEETAEKAYMKPAASLDDALAQARKLLQPATAAAPRSAQSTFQTLRTR